MGIKDEIWVYLETGVSGTVKPVSAELISAARSLADQSGYGLTAIVIGYGVSDGVLYGVERVIAVDDPALTVYNTDMYTHALCSLMSERPAVLIMGATADGRDLAPRIACRLNTGLTADCTGLRWDADLSRVVWTRPTFGGRLMAEIVCRDGRPQMGTVCAGAFRPFDGGGVPAIMERVFVDFSGIMARAVALPAEGAAEVESLSKADVILAGGRGLGADGFRLMEELARHIDAEIGASRAVVEAGWVSAARQIGQSGQSVRPKRYVAFGISGAAQHMAGLFGAGHITAINSDPNAPIFAFADIGIVGDAKEILTEMIEQSKPWGRSPLRILF